MPPPKFPARPEIFARTSLRIRDFASRAKESGAELIVFPEMVDTGYSMPVIQKHATSWNEGAVPELQQMAKSLSLAIICGVSERDGPSIYNSQVFIDAEWESHLEISKDTPGHGRSARRAPVLHGRRRVCQLQDRQVQSRPEHLLRPAVSRNVPRTLAVDHHVNVFVISSAWPFPRVEHFRILATARAIENQSYVIAANRVGTDDGVTFCGSSAIIDPLRCAVAAASADREELIKAEISEEVHERRSKCRYSHGGPSLLIPCGDALRAAPRSTYWTAQDRQLERAVQRNHSVGRRAAGLVELNIGAVKIEASIRLITSLGRQRQDRRDFPIEAGARSHFAVTEHGMIEPRIPCASPKLSSTRKFVCLMFAPT